MAEEQQYIAYPRSGYGSRYGTLARLEALGNFCRNLSWQLIGMCVLAGFFEFGLASFGHSPELMTFLLVALGLWGVYSPIAKRASMLAVGMGWNKLIGSAVAAMAVLISIAAFVVARIEIGWVWAMPPLATFVAGAVGLYVANNEMSRYGIPISPFKSHGSMQAFDRAVDSRRALDANPNPLASTDMYSGEPPRAA